MTLAGVDLLGGATRRATRVRGFAPWHPQRQTLAVLDQVRAVLVEYASYLPLTIRQVFYRLVGAHGYPKTEAGYDRLGECLNRARRARVIPMDAIRDDGGARFDAPGWQSAADFLGAIRTEAANAAARSDARPARPADDPVRGRRHGAAARPQAAEYGVPVISSGGFDSVTEKAWAGRGHRRERAPAPEPTHCRYDQTEDTK